MNDRPADEVAPLAERPQAHRSSTESITTRMSVVSFMPVARRRQSVHARAMALVRSYPSMSEAPLIGICGPIGAGKSTIVCELAAALKLHWQREDVAANRFFKRSVADPATW